jgi:hypothetical protein
VSESNQSSAPRRGSYDEGPCEAELHLRLCARRLTTGHLQFRWRVEHLDSIGDQLDSQEGYWGPFTLPHEAGQDVAAAVRRWWKESAATISRHSEWPDGDEAGEQLTLRDFMAD